ncbi:hypothetical protein NIES2104_55960 [Leptolyngbya sp. NIES-2104]|nr:hypothetical protein NIES2104_55960 [Leptolyngbya sp. NIES-2104]
MCLNQRVEVVSVFITVQSGINQKKMSIQTVDFQGVFLQPRSELQF